MDQSFLLDELETAVGIAAHVLGNAPMRVITRALTRVLSETLGTTASSPRSRSRFGTEGDLGFSTSPDSSPERITR